MDRAKNPAWPFNLPPLGFVDYPFLLPGEQGTTAALPVLFTAANGCQQLMNDRL